MRYWKSDICRYVLVLLVYSVLTIAMTWPVFARLTTHLIGNGDDMWVHYWNGWWIKRCLERGESFFYTSLLFHPTGVSLEHQNFAWVNIAIWLVIEPLVGGIAAYNLVHLLHIPLCGLGMFLLARRLLKSDAIAFVSGLVFAFWPYRMLDVNHPNLISTEVFPILMLAVFQLFHDEKPVKRGIIAGFLAAVIGYMRLQLAVLAGIMVSLYLLYILIWERQLWDKRRTVALILMSVVTIGLMMPLLYPFLREQLTGGLPEEIYAVDATDREQDLLAWLVPQHQHPLSDVFDQLFRGYGTSRVRERYSAFLGYGVVGLIILAVLKQRQRGEIRFWVGLGILCFTLALGPYLQFNGVHYFGIPLPYQLLRWVPVLKLLGEPRRFNALLGLPVAVLAGFGAVSFREWLGQRQWGKRIARPVVFASVLGLLVLIDYYSIPTATVQAHVPDFYIGLAGESGDFALVGLPGKRHHTERYMFYQTLHQRPILGGHVSRLPPEALEFASSVPLVDGMYHSARRGGLDTMLPDVSRQLSLLSENGFRYIIMHKHLAPPDRVDAWRSYLAVPPYYEDDKVVVFSTAPVVGVDCPLEYSLGAGVGLIDVQSLPDSVRPGDEVELDVVWGTTMAPERALQFELLLVSEEDAVEQVERFELSPSWPTQEWPANTIVREKYGFQIESRINGGTQNVVFRLIDEHEGLQVGHSVNVGSMVVVAPERSFVIPSMERDVAAVFGEELRLLGYALDEGDDAIRITLHWQAVRRMDTSYVMFVHLIDPDTDQVVSQADVIPYGYTYPTLWWEADEVVSDRIEIPLQDVAPGMYRLAVGVYEYETGARLPVRDSSGDLEPADRLVLSEEVWR